jgi:carbon storage regulator
MRTGPNQGGNLLLVLNRKVGERILLPSANVVLTVVSVKGNQVRPGISAPADVAVYREEVWRQIVRQTHGLSSEK